MKTQKVISFIREAKYGAIAVSAMFSGFSFTAVINTRIFQDLP
jgi:hypothetical protein